MNIDTNAYDQATEEAIESTDDTALETSDDGSQEQEQQAGTEEQAATAQEEFDRNKWEMKHRGQTVYPKDRQHLINLAQQGYSYSTRMGELNTREQELQTQAQRYAQYGKLEEAFNSNPQLGQAVWNLYNQHVNGIGAEQPEYDQDEEAPWAKPVQSMQQELAELKAEREAQAAREEDGKLQQEMEALKGAHSEHDWDSDEGDGTLMKQVLNYALQAGHPTLEAAYRDMMWDTHTVQTEAKALERAKKAKQAQARKGIVTDGRSAPSPTPGKPDYSKMDYKQLEQEALREWNS